MPVLLGKGKACRARPSASPPLQEAVPWSSTASCLELNYTISAFYMVSSVISVDTSRLDKKSGIRRVTLLLTGNDMYVIRICGVETKKKVEIFITFR